MRYVPLTLLLVALVSCQSDRSSEADAPPDVTDFSVGKWQNRYADDPALAGVRVQQFPDCMHDAARYEGKHPAMILYVFTDRRVNQVGYNPDGTVHEDFWWPTKADDALMEQIDRSCAAP